MDNSILVFFGICLRLNLDLFTGSFRQFGRVNFGAAVKPNLKNKKCRFY